MNRLSAHCIERVIRHDWEVHQKLGLRNNTRFYHWLIIPLFSPDVEVHTVAVLCARRPDRHGERKTYVKEVVRASVDHPDMYIRDLAFGAMAGYRVDWSKEKLNHVGWDYEGKWQAEPYSAVRGMWKLHCEVINPNVLQLSERFKWCSWKPECGHILDYLKCYVKHPRIELLSKIGLGRFARRQGFVSQLESNKPLMRWFSAHVEEIKAQGCGCDVIRTAYRNGLSISEARDRIEVARMFRRLGLPRAVDAMRAREYVARTKAANHFNYCDYLYNCVTLGLDLADTKTTFPRQFKARAIIVKDQVAELERRKQANLARERSQQAKRLDADIAATAARFSKLEKAGAAFRIIFPKRADDFVKEGKRLHNCLGDGHYAAKMARGETLVAFLRRVRKSSQPFVAIEYSPDQKKVLQIYGSDNSKPEPRVLAFVNRVFMNQRRIA